MFILPKGSHLILRNFNFVQFTIECPVFAIPLAKVQWTFNGGLLQSKHQTVNNDLVLSEESDLSDAGRYGCSASNPLGNDRASSNVVFLGKCSLYLKGEK